MCSPHFPKRPYAQVPGTCARLPGLQDTSGARDSTRRRHRLLQALEALEDIPASCERLALVLVAEGKLSALA